MKVNIQNAGMRSLNIIYKANDSLRNFIQHEEKLPRHLTQSIALEESPLPHVVRVGVAMIAGLIAVFILWASLTSVEEVASAAGQVIPSGHVQAIQHLEGGIVKEILVHDGDIVVKDQPLLKLDDTSSGADLGQIKAREKNLDEQAQRLRRFTGSNFKESSMTSEESEILKSMEDARASQRSVLGDQIAQKEKQLRGLTSARESLEKNVSLMERENTIKQNLAAKGYGSELMALTSERELNQMKGQLAEAASQEEQASDAIRESQNRLVSLNADLKQESMKTLGQVEGELAEVRKNIEKLQGTARRMSINSPVNGVVKGLAVNTVGAVIEPAKVLMEIVPVDNELMVEAMVNPSDVGHLKPGQKVNVKVSAYEFSRYGSADGTLENVSATTFQTQDGKSFYKARVKLNETHVGSDKSRNLILPGMTVQADIITGERSILQYLLKPIHVAMETAFHEH